MTDLAMMDKGTTMLAGPKLHKELGSFLKNKRVQLGLTQSEVAQKLGYSSPQFISNVERGLCAPPLKSLKKITELLQIDPKDLMSLILSEQQAILQTALGGRSSRKKRRA